MPEFDGEQRCTRDRHRHDHEALFSIRSVLGVSFHFSANPRTPPNEAETSGNKDLLISAQNRKDTGAEEADPKITDTAHCESGLCRDSVLQPVNSSFNHDYAGQ